MKRLQRGWIVIMAGALAIGPAAPAQTYANDGSLNDASRIADPVPASRAEYGRIDRPGAVRFYSVTPSETVTVTIEAVVPVRNASMEFRPTVAVLLPEATPSEEKRAVPFSVPSGYDVRVLQPEHGDPRPTLFDPNSIERFYRGESTAVSLPGKQTTYLAVFDPDGRTGDYVVGVASRPNYENASRTDLLLQGLALKFGAAPGRPLPWADVGGAIIAMLALAAAATVGLGVLLLRPRAASRLRRWRRWVVGGALVSVLGYYAGLRILNLETGTIAVASFQEVLTVLLLLAALWLAIQSPDRPARRYRSFILLWSTGWLAQTALLAWYLLVTRTT